MKNTEVVKQNFQSDWQLVALEIHNYLTIGWNFVTTPFRWLAAQLDSTPTIKE